MACIRQFHLARCVQAPRRLHCRLTPVRRSNTEFLRVLRSLRDFALKEFQWWPPSEEFPTTVMGQYPTSSRQRLEPAERDYARTGRLPFPRRLRQRVVPG